MIEMQIGHLNHREKVMSELISGKEALRALADGKQVEYLYGDQWLSCVGEQVLITAFTGDKFKFRIKPRTIMIGDMEVPAPFEPNSVDHFYYIDSSVEKGYSLKNWVSEHSKTYSMYGAWRTEAEIKQVVAALRKLLKGATQ